MLGPALHRDKGIPEGTKVLALKYYSLGNVSMLSLWLKVVTYEKASNGIDGHEYHDTTNKPPVEFGRGNSQQSKSDRQLDDADGNKEDGLTDEIELHSFLEDIWFNIANVFSSTIYNRGNDDTLTSPI